MLEKTSSLIFFAAFTIPIMRRWSKRNDALDTRVPKGYKHEDPGSEGEMLGANPAILKILALIEGRLAEL